MNNFYAESNCHYTIEQGTEFRDFCEGACYNDVTEVKHWDGGVLFQINQ